MMQDEIKTHFVSDQEALHQTIIDMTNAMQEAVAPYMTDAADPLDAVSAVMTAAAMLSGSQFGLLLVLGAVDQKDTKRAVDAAGRNFREGIKVGVSRATRVEREHSFGGSA